MSFADPGSFEQFADVLRTHRSWAYFVLFAGAFFETVIPFSLLVLGEVFFLAGAWLAGLHVLDVWIVMGVLFLGGLLGDNASYWMGRHFGPGLFGRLARWPLVGRLVHRENHQRGIAFFRRRGALAVFAARFSGPLSWVTPALAGTFGLNYPVFLRYNTPAVILGISPFIAVGYFFGHYIPALLAWAHTAALAVALGLIAALVLVTLARRRSGKRIR